MDFTEKQLGLPSHSSEGKDPQCSFIDSDTGRCDEPPVKEIIDLSSGLTFDFCELHADQAMIKWASFDVEVV